MNSYGLGPWVLSNKPNEFIRFVAMDVTKPYEFIKFGAMDVTKPCEFIRFGAMDITKPYEFIRCFLNDFSGTFLGTLLVCGADFCCNLHCRTSPVVLEGFWGQVWPKIGRKPEKSEYRIANEPLS